MKLGKKCTPGHDEWSYVWFIEKEKVQMSAEKIVQGKDWRERRIAAINRQIDKFNGTRDINEYYADEQCYKFVKVNVKLKRSIRYWIQKNGKV